MALAPPYQRIVFDCDSTLSRVEGIEELARGAPQHQQAIEELTRKAMAGELALDQVYLQRLELLSPRQLDVIKIGSRYIETAMPHARELISALHALDKEVRIISGGLRLPVVAFAGWLGVHDPHVHAVQVHFDRHGRYLDYDRASPLTRNDGKREVLESLPAARTVFIGDGITDAETRPAVDGFVCFAAVVHRQEVAARADAVISSSNMLALLPLLCSEDELETLRRHPRHARLLTMAGEA